MIVVDLHYRANSRGPVEALLRAKQDLALLGVMLVDRGEKTPRPEQGKVIASQQFYTTIDVLNGDSPIVLLERADAAISWCRKEAKHPNVKKILKIATLQPPALNNFCRGRYHSSLLDKRTKEPCRVVLEPEELAKLTPGAGYGTYSIMRRWIDLPFNLRGNRPYTIHFAGTTHYGERDEITRHRTNALKAIKKIKGKHVIVEGRHMPREEYDQKMIQAKIVVSPWGFGETAYRDYEAMYAGSVLIKPDSSFVRTWPQIFTNGVTYIPCHHNWSDLAEKVQYVLDNWNDLEGMRLRNYELLKKHWKASTIARYYASIFEAALHGKSEKKANA